mmetsp:Transcript_43366/g.44058  ORF Transcript_43366/g.44058 Transcript_43366/m.44058 type:complete len:185 (-) Transcript_43366:87-641(-)
MNHEKTYDRWKRKENAMGEHKRPRKGTRKRSSSTNTSTNTNTRNELPFWKEEGSILSVLLGHNWNDSRPPQRSLRSHIDDLFGAFRSSTSITVCIRKVLLVLSKIIGSLCRWASVRDTIPRPIIFLSAFAAAFVSQPGARIKNILVTFLSIRVFGEWLSQPLPHNAHNRQDAETARRSKKKKER